MCFVRTTHTQHCAARHLRNTKRNISHRLKKKSVDNWTRDVLAEIMRVAPERFNIPEMIIQPVKNRAVSLYVVALLSHGSEYNSRELQFNEVST